MRLTLQRAALFLITLASLLMAADVTLAQEQEHSKRLRSPATARGVIGGESHDSYVIRARKGQTMTLQISSRPVPEDKQEPVENHGDNPAGFWVGELPGFDGNGYVRFGKKSNQGKRWRGKIPKTRNYYIYVSAFPTAQYTLRVTVQ